MSTHTERNPTVAAHLCSQSDRFDRLDEKLDKITDLLVSNARIEQRTTEIEANVNDHEARIRSMETIQTACSAKNGVINKGVWETFKMLIAAVLAAAGTYYTTSNH